MHDPSDGPTGSYAPLVAQDPLVGKVLRQAYQIEGRIGEGGMGVVYRAVQIALGRHVAVKTIALERYLPETAFDRFFREARLLSQLHHPNIVQIIDFGTEMMPAPPAGGQPSPLHFMVMEYLRGENLEEFVHLRGRLAPELVLDLLEQICSGVLAAHQAQVIHRDLKPANILVTQMTGSHRPIVKILDFGLGKMVREEGRTSQPGLTREGAMLGTLGYSAPEQLEGSTVDARADIYSLGAIVYFLFTGRPPYRDEGLRTTLVKQLSQPPDPMALTDLPGPVAEAIEQVVRQAMSHRPEERFATAGELYAALVRVLRSGETISDRGRSSRIEERRALPLSHEEASVSRRGWLLAGGVALVGSLAGLAVWGARRPRGSAGAGATAPGVTASEILLGMSGPFTGTTRELGRAMQTGLEACFKHVNETAPVHGRQIRLIALDDGYEPDRAAANVQRLLDENDVFAFVGNVGTPTTEAALPLISRSERLLFGAYTGARHLREDPPNRFVFNYRASYAEETAAIVQYLVKVRGLPPGSIAVFAQNDSYGESGFEGVARAMRKLGGMPDTLLRVGYERNASDVNKAVQTILAARDRIRAVVMVATYRPAARFIQAIRDAKFTPLFTNVSFVGSVPLADELKQAGPQYTSGVIVTQVVPHPTSNATGVIEYRRQMTRYASAEPPGFVSLEGYLVGRILVEGLRRAGPQLTTDRLIEGLEQIRDLDLAVGTKITFGPSEHQGSHKVWGTQLDAQGHYRDLDLE
ncbi:MAG: ABC transporter substrate-binding protein [Gemmataceae bacterium]